jgi:hypothetical protein
MRRLSIAMTILLLHAGAAVAQNYGKYSVELRGGAAFPTEKIDNITLNTGPALGIAGTIKVLRTLKVYAGWDWRYFSVENVSTLNNHSMQQTGYNFGAQFEREFAPSLKTWVSAGGVYDHAELEDGAGDIIADSGHELGWEVGVGVALPISNFTISQGIRYRTLSVDLANGATPISGNLSYIAVELGVAWSPGKRPAVAARWIDSLGRN